MNEVHLDLYREHLEEASFLYEQRFHLLGDPEMPWTALHDFEQRLEAHIDALVVGGDLALSVCQERAEEGDAGELFAAVCVFCRQLKAPLLTAALKHPKASEPEHARALAEALKHELPSAWNENCLRALEASNEALLPVLATAVGYRRIASHGLLSRKLADAQAPARRTLLWAVGRTRESEAAAAVHATLVPGSLAADPDALAALLRLQDPEAAIQLRQPEATTNAAAQWLAMGIGRPCTAALVARLTSDSPPNRNVMQALGLLGDLAAVRPLLRCLAIKDAAADASEALHVITGASLFEELVVPEPVEQDEMLEGEALQYQQAGQPLPNASGSKVRRLSQNPALWEEWITTHSSQFTAHRRFRCGQPFGPVVLLQCLASNDYPKTYRNFIIDELMVSYAIELPLEIDMRVSEQQQVMRDAAPDITAASSRFELGRWYVGGRLSEAA